MRRLIALVLAFLMMLSLVGCAATQEQADALLESLKQAQQLLNTYAALCSDQAEDVFHVQSAQDFHWNGKTTVWFMLPVNASPEDILAADAMGAVCQACGWTYEKRELGSSKDGTSTDLLKQALLDGGVGAVVFTQLQDYTADLVQTAADTGIIVLCIDPDTTAAAAGSIVTDEAALGQATYDLIADWTAQAGLEADQDSLGIPVAVNTYGQTQGQDDWSVSLGEYLTDSDTLYESDVTLENSSDTIFGGAYLWARSAMAEEPATRIFCCYTPEAAYGVCYYLEQYCADQELDLTDFCVVWVGQDEDSGTYLSVAQESSTYTAARGYVLAQDSPCLTGARLAHQLLGIAYGSELPVSLNTAFAVLEENGLSLPSAFEGWQWGLNAAVGITTYASFDSDEEFIHARNDMPLADILLAAQAS